MSKIISLNGKQYSAKPINEVSNTFKPPFDNQLYFGSLTMLEPSSDLSESGSDTAVVDIGSFSSSDFYEEGHFTPTMTVSYSQDVADKTYSSSSSSGIYVRTGKLVFFQLSFRNVQDALDTNGVLYIRGLPYKSSYYNDAEVCAINVRSMRFSSCSQQNSVGSSIPVDPSTISAYISLEGVLSFHTIDKNFPLQDVSFADSTSGVDVVVSGTYMSTRKNDLNGT